MSTVPLRVAFWNAWLLRPRFWSGGPAIPGGGAFAPQVPERAPLVGAAVRGRFDVCALGEVFEPSEQQAVAEAAGTRLVAGPGRAGVRVTASGLATLVAEDHVTVTEVATHRYRAGGDLRDADTFATKGALLCRLRVAEDRPEVDLVSTHLFAGGGMVPGRGVGEAARHHRVRMAQVDELVAFVARHRSPARALLLVGDFNVPAVDPDPTLADPGERHRDLAERLAPLGVGDVWATHGVGPGPTCTFATAADIPPDPADGDRVADDGPAGSGERIDYLWFASPTEGGAKVTVDRPRRWAFPGRGVQGGPAGSLSDHLALSTTLHLGVVPPADRAS